jgi:hypothetical protein
MRGRELTPCPMASTPSGSTLSTLLIPTLRHNRYDGLIGIVPRSFCKGGSDRAVCVVEPGRAGGSAGKADDSIYPHREALAPSSVSPHLKRAFASSYFAT